MPRAKPQPTRKRRRLFRWCFGLALVGLLVVGGCFGYINRVGLPPFAKALLQTELQANGLDLEFERLRWRAGHGLVAEGIHLQVTQTNAQPTFTAQELEIQLVPQSLIGGQPKVDSVILRDGQIALQLPEIGIEEAVNFQISGLHTHLSFPSPNHWVLNQLQAQCLGLDLQLTANVTNAYALRQWQAKRKPREGPPKWPQILRQIDTIRQQLNFDDTPILRIDLDMDAAQPDESRATLTLECPRADSPWGVLEQLSLTVSTDETGPGNDAEFGSQWTLSVGKLQQGETLVNHLQLTANVDHDRLTGRVTRVNWTLNTGPAVHAIVGADALQVLGNTQHAAERPDWFDSSLEVVMNEVTGPALTLDRARLSTAVQHRSNWREATGNWEGELTELTTKWATAATAAFSGTFLPAPEAADQQPPAWGPWTSLAGLQLAFELDTAKVDGSQLQADHLGLQAKWTPPRLELQSVRGTLYDGGFDFAGKLDVETRNVDLKGQFDFDVHRIRHLLTEKGQRWLRQYTFDEPPLVNVDASVTLPAWDDPEPDWRGEVKPTMRILGDFTAGNAAFRTVPVTAASSKIIFTNMIWSLPNLHIERPEGNVLLDYRCDARTQDYHWRVDGHIDYHALAPLLGENQKKGLALFDLRQPVHTHGDIWGRWYARELTRFKTDLATTNFVFRGVPIDTFKTHLSYVNGLVTGQGLQIELPSGALSADRIQINSHSRLITLTNAVSNAETMAVAKMIGPSIERSFRSYHFDPPPTITANGIIPIDNLGPADAHFQIQADGFSFWRFEVPQIDADVDWVGRKVDIRNVDADFYEGVLRGDLSLKLKRGRGAEFGMDARVLNADLNSLFVDVFSPENKSQGMLNGHLVIDSGETDDWKSWGGHGDLQLRDGLLWDTPLFGIFSPVLNALSPGLGNSRANTGRATFTIRDSIIHTDDLVVQEPTTRLLYQGKLDFDGNLDARVEAVLLRDAPMVGRLMSLALWPVSKLFVYEVGGNLRKPEARPVYELPRFLMNPVSSIRDRMSPPDPKKNDASN